MEDGTYSVEAVETSLEVLDALNEFTEAGVSEIAAEIDRPVSTTHNHLRTLVEHEYVVKEDETYRIGFRTLELGGRRRDQEAVYQYGRPEVEELARNTGETANLVVEEFGLVTHLYSASGEQAMQFDIYTGKRMPMYYTGNGKAILSQLDEDRIREIIDERGLSGRTENTIIDPDELFEELREIRERGYAVDDEEKLKGLRCVAAPIVVDDEVIGAISVSGPISRFKGDLVHEELPEMVISSAELVGIKISYP